MEVKPVIIAKDGVAKIGSDIITLTDQSVNKFSTTDIIAFVTFIVAIATSLADKAAAIFYDTTTIVLKSLTASMKQEVIALCKMELHPILILISNVVNQKLSIEKMDEFLYILRPYYSGTEAKELYDRLQKLTVKNVESITREKDQKGNYYFACGIKAAEGSLEFPSTLSFLTPVFDNIDSKTIQSTFDLFIDFHKDDEDKPTMSFTLKNPLFNELLEAEGRKIIEGYLESIEGYQKYYGSLSTIEKTDSWKYQKNSL